MPDAISSSSPSSTSTAAASSSSDTTRAQAGVTLAYISDGSLYVARPGQEPKRVESAFARQVNERAAAIERKHAWKGKGRTGPYRQMVWGLGEQAGGTYHHVSISGLCVDGERLLYAQQSGQVSGVFRIEVGEETLGENERRLFHTTDLAVQDLGGVEQHGYVVCSLRGDNFASHIAVLHEDGSEVTELTAGDSIDCAPTWVPNHDRVLVYQSTGIQRDAQGHLAGFTPSVIQQLDVGSGELALALEQAGYDLYAPRVDAEGTLYCLRKKSRPFNQRNIPAMIWHAVTSPFWLIYAFIVWLGVFITSYTGRRMIRPGMHVEDDETVEQGETRARVRATDAKDADIVEDDDSKEPTKWILSHELVRCRRGGKPEVITRGVLAFDLLPGGQLACTNGRSVFVLNEKLEREELLKAKQVTAVRVVGTRPS